MATNAKQFSLICEAFDVLSSYNHKSIYDAYGLTVLKNKFAPEQKGDSKGVQYIWKNNANEIFENFFGDTTHLLTNLSGAHPDADLDTTSFDLQGSMMPDSIASI